MQIVVGCIVLSFYHFYFFILVASFALFGVIFIRWTGIGGLTTSIKESDRKYDTADLFREMRDEMNPQNIDSTDSLNVKYINSRKRHFFVKVRQSIVILVMIALANSVLLGVGGWLVVNGEITVGRLIAAEIILALVLSALDKLSGLISDFYDLMTALVKLDYVRNLNIGENKDELTIITRSY
ncbi:MAG: hypothetical protein QNJ31_04555 [Candidatus Caenarcaniphilales bacterium]|nr:hypothetical protein [Candidatus Caenarcaniphilales bacterium]